MARATKEAALRNLQQLQQGAGVAAHGDVRRIVALFGTFPLRKGRNLIARDGLEAT